MYVVRLAGPLRDDCREASWILNPTERERKMEREREKSFEICNTKAGN
jgi:hypothetical protein